MKKIVTLYRSKHVCSFKCFSLFTALFCYISLSAQTYQWNTLSAFPGARVGVVSFVINDVAYAGGGGNMAHNVSYNDFYRFDPVAHTWTAIAPFPGNARSAATAFSLGGYGYVGTGVDPAYQIYSDFYRYDPTQDKWERIADIPGYPRYNAISFTIGSYAYVGTGAMAMDQHSKSSDVYRYDPSSDSWQQVADFPGARYGAIAFSIGEKAYAGTGYDGSYLKDFYQYDPDANTWSAVADFPAQNRFAAVGFSIGNMGYAGTGYYHHYDAATSSEITTYFRDMYVYDPAVNNWSAIADLKGPERQVAAAFSVKGYGFVGTGNNTTGDLNDFYQLTTSASSPLPAKLLSFTAALINKTHVRLNWSTALEVQTKAFTIERSADGSHFTPAGTLTADGNSTAEKSYFFDDPQAISGTIFYRLVTSYSDGKQEYSNIIRLVSGTGSFGLYPNPASNMVRLEWQGNASPHTLIRIKDATGRLVKEIRPPFTGTGLSLDISGFKSGLYYIIIDKESRAFIKQ